MSEDLALTLLLLISATLWTIVIWRFVKLFKEPIIPPVVKTDRDTLPSYDNNNSDDNKGYNNSEPNGASLTETVNLNNKPYNKTHAKNETDPFPSKLCIFRHDCIISQEQPNANSTLTKIGLHNLLNSRFNC